MKKKVSKVLSVMCSVATLTTLFGINSASAMDGKDPAEIPAKTPSAKTPGFRVPRETEAAKVKAAEAEKADKAASVDDCDSKISSPGEEIHEAIKKIDDFKEFLELKNLEIMQIDSEYSRYSKYTGYTGYTGYGRCGGCISLRLESETITKIVELEELREKLKRAKCGDESVDDVHELIRNEPILKKSLDDFEREFKCNLINIVREVFMTSWSTSQHPEARFFRDKSINKLVFGFLKSCKKYGKEYRIEELNNNFFIAVVDNILNNEEDVKDLDLRTFVSFVKHVMKENDKLRDVSVNGVKFDEFVSSYIKLAKLKDAFPFISNEDLYKIFSSIYSSEEEVVINREIVKEIEEAEKAAKEKAEKEKAERNGFLLQSESLTSEAASADDSSSPDKEIDEAIGKIKKCEEYLESERSKIEQMGSVPISLRFKGEIEDKKERLQELREELERAKRGDESVGDVQKLIRNKLVLRKSVEEFKRDFKHDLDDITYRMVSDLCGDTEKLKDDISSENFANKWIFMFLKSIELYHLSGIDKYCLIVAADDIMGKTRDMKDIQLRIMASLVSRMERFNMSCNTSLVNGINLSQLVSTYRELAELEGSSSVEDRKLAEEILGKFFNGGKIPEVNEKVVLDIVNAMESVK